MNNTLTKGLVLNNVCKSYGDKKIIHHLTYQFHTGCHVLTGHNGSGKSTLLKLICGAEKVNAGDIRFNGYDLYQDELSFKKQLGYAPDKLMVYPFLTGKELLNLIFSIKKDRNQNSIDSILNGFRITPYLSYCLEEMSLGNQKKYMLAAAFIGNPDLLLLDEPTNEIDIGSKNYLISLINKKINEGKTIILSSHDKEFIDKINPIEHRMPEIFTVDDCVVTSQ